MHFEMPLLTAAADRLLKTEKNPFHRKILENYRRHAQLEVCGRWEEIMSPDMTVESPRYVIHSAKGVTVLDGLDAVSGLYRSYVDTNSTVIFLEREEIMLSDWGFASEAVSHRLWQGKYLAATGETIDDPEAWYITSNLTGMFWPYSKDGRMAGEHVYRGGDRTVRKADPGEVISRQQVQEMLDPYIKPLGTYS
ncbi:hypothetical protein BWP39_31040 [Paraburkholderia acidicola]|uniref:SnoaL-like protein n=1 Tax=Paraburkholderia acidicola TaxID=1912599 RepID=A0A2A4ER66_9BURK|nr:hypothetical protein [Paraburkholderia acidicola]PCE24123.1 hypothetical protein BWP39_31040 [Paraburkholderia acidicola]